MGIFKRFILSLFIIPETATSLKMTSMVSNGQYPRETVVNNTNQIEIAGIMES